MQTITPSALRELMQGEREWTLFDIREAAEADRAHIPGA